MRVLIIDDDEDLRNLLGHYILQRWKDATVEDYDPVSRDMPGAEFPLGNYDVLILDYMLGSGDGLQWLTELKKRPDCPKVLFLTGAGNEVIAVKAMKQGADDYQRKQELTRDRLITSLTELTAAPADRAAPELVSRKEGHELGGRIRIPGIKVLRLIGEGGTARVYLASRDGDDTPLVVKILRPEITANEKALSRCLDEFGLLERVQSRHVARIFGHGKFEGHAYLVMEFFEGGDLAKRLEGKAMPPDEALRLLRELMFALGDIHEKGILHRDLKPQNLMFREDGSLAIVDFGIAKDIAGVDRTNVGDIVGTPRYMSPEQVQGRALDLRTDLYSAGVLFYQMLSGKHLFEGASAVEIALHHVNTPPPALPDGLEKYQRLVDKLVEKDRDARFRNTDEVIGFLERKFYQGTRPLGASLPPETTQKLH